LDADEMCIRLLEYGSKACFSVVPLVADIAGVENDIITSS
jgi:hypothetical protein